MKWNGLRMKHDIKLEIREHPARAVPYIDQKYLPFCVNIDHFKNFDTGEDIMKFDSSGYIFTKDCECDLSDYVNIAIIILRDELLKHGELYDGFVASINSSLKDQKLTGIPFQPEREISENILKRIIGEA